MATTKDVENLSNGRKKYRGETFAGYNKPKKTPGENKKSAVLAKKGDQVKIVRFGDPKMSINQQDVKVFVQDIIVIRQLTNLQRGIGRVRLGDVAGDSTSLY